MDWPCRAPLHLSSYRFCVNTDAENGNLGGLAFPRLLHLSSYRFCAHTDAVKENLGGLALPRVWPWELVRGHVTPVLLFC